MSCGAQIRRGLGHRDGVELEKLNMKNATMNFPANEGGMNDVRVEYATLLDKVKRRRDSNYLTLRGS